MTNSYVPQILLEDEYLSSKNRFETQQEAIDYAKYAVEMNIAVRIEDSHRHPNLKWDGENGAVYFLSWFTGLWNKIMHGGKISFF